MGFLFSKSRPGYFEVPTYGKQTTQNVSQATASRLSEMFGLGAGANNIYGGQEDIVGGHTGGLNNKFEVYKVNNPYQVGTSQFNSQGYQSSTQLATRTASTVFAGISSSAPPAVIKSLDIKGS